jgi:uncharacterized protein
MHEKPNKIIIDSNLWISYLIKKDYFWLDKLIKNEDICLVFSDELITEFLDVVHRPKFTKYISKSDLGELIEIFDKFCVYFKVVSDVDLCRDSKDNFLLNLAIDSEADYILTGDSDLLALKQIGKTKILTTKQFKDNFLIKSQYS